ncbi:MAG: hypothetical protein QGI93_11985, partial [Planctomycetota bacterium]|nr:hypothetical protein [Planctomycetota bacterium]
RRARGAVQARTVCAQGGGQGGTDGVVRLEEIAQVLRVIGVLRTERLDLGGRGLGVRLEEVGQDLLGCAVGWGGSGQGSDPPLLMMTTM